MKTKKPAYKSAKRNQPIENWIPPLFGVETQLAADVDPKQGRLTWKPTGPSFSDTYRLSTIENRRLMHIRYSNVISGVTDSIEIEYRLACAYFSIIHGIGSEFANPVFTLLENIFAANLVAMKTATELTLDGLYSNARPLLRQVYEGLMLAKFASVAPNSDVYDKWLDGKYIRFTADILNRIESPRIVEFSRIWGDLSEFTHSSYYSGQPDLHNEPVVEQAGLNFVIVQMMLEANYHLFGSHILNNNLRYYQKRYGVDTNVSDNLKRLKTHFTSGRNYWMAKPAKAFVQHYKRKWKIKQ